MKISVNVYLQYLNFYKGCIEKKFTIIHFKSSTAVTSIVTDALICNF